MTDCRHTLAARIQRFSGFTGEYDRWRPQPRVALARLLTTRPTLAVGGGD
jgi:hypothetical protein